MALILIKRNINKYTEHSKSKRILYDYIIGLRWYIINELGKTKLFFYQTEKITEVQMVFVMKNAPAKLMIFDDP